MLIQSAISCSALLSLAVTASASPENTISERQHSVSIPFHGTGSLTKKDGVFDKERAIILSVATHNKHRQNLIKIEKNLGGDKLNKVCNHTLLFYTLRLISVSFEGCCSEGFYQSPRLRGQ
jgi:hypothetical protein